MEVRRGRLDALMHCRSLLGELVLSEAKRVNSVGACKELAVAWGHLHVTPSCVGPSARNKLKVLVVVIVSRSVLLSHRHQAGIA